jgi:RNA polymerase sigma factor (sigma-70 family)
MMSHVDAGEEFRQHSTDLLRFATLLVGPADAPDVVSEAVTATLARRSLDGVENVRAYWFRAVLYTASRHHQRASGRRRREARFAGREASKDDSLEPTDARRLLVGLSAQQKAVVFLTYWHDLPPASVAELLGVSDGTVRKQLARARVHLREVIIDDRA